MMVVVLGMVMEPDDVPPCASSLVEDEEELVDSSEAGFSLEDDEPEEPHIVSDRFSPEIRSGSPYLGEGSIRREPVRKPTHYPKEVESTTNILNFLGSMEKKFRKKRGK